MRSRTAALFRMGCCLASALLVTAAACNGLREANLTDGTTGDAAAADAESEGEDGGTKDDASPKRDSGAKGGVEILATGLRYPREIVLGADTVYFTLNQNDDAVVRKVGKNGTGAAIVAAYDASSGLNPLGRDIEIVGGEVVFVNGTSSVGRIAAIPTDGGVERIVRDALDRPEFLAHHGGFLYFNDQSLSPSYAVRRMPVGGGAPVVLLTGQIRVGGIAADSSGVYWTHGGPLAGGKKGVRHVRLDALDAGVDLNVGSTNGDVGGLALGPTDVFWADTEEGRILRVSKEGGITAVLATELARPLRVVLDGGYVYFSQYGSGTKSDGKISRVRVSGGAVEDLVTSLYGPLGVAVDATHVYWTSYDRGEVSRIEK